MIDSDVLNTGWRIASWVLAALVLLAAARGAPWRALHSQSRNHHVFLGSLTGVAIVWSMQAGITAGLAMHFLLVTTLTLMHGWRLTVLGVAMILTGLAATGRGVPMTVPVNVLCIGFVPAIVTAGIHRLVETRLPNNYFVYFFGTVFAGSAIAFNAAGLARLAVLVTAGAPIEGHIGPEYVIWLPMMSFAEAFLNGMLMAILVVYRPEWVQSFDDRRYLRDR
jgi:uncharacterized membrane protein